MTLLADRGVPGLRELALFSTAIDTMVHGQDLLALVVGDEQRRDGSIRPIIEVARARGMPPVRCALSNASTKALEKWITASGKKRTDYLFPGRGVEGRHPMGQRQLNRLLKLWVVEAGLDPSDYSVEVATPDKGSPHFERHWRFADSSSATGPCKNREHREISRSQNKGRPNRGLSGLRYLTLLRDFRVKMWGTASPEDKLTGDLGNVIEATSIGGRRSDFFYSKKIGAGNLGLLQQYLPQAD